MLWGTMHPRGWWPDEPLATHPPVQNEADCDYLHPTTKPSWYVFITILQKWTWREVSWYLRWPRHHVVAQAGCPQAAGLDHCWHGKSSSDRTHICITSRANIGIHVHKYIHVYIFVHTSTHARRTQVYHPGHPPKDDGALSWSLDQFPYFHPNNYTGKIRYEHQYEHIISIQPLAANIHPGDSDVSVCSQQSAR